MYLLVSKLGWERSGTFQTKKNKIEDKKQMYNIVFNMVSKSQITSSDFIFLSFCEQKSSY